MAAARGRGVLMRFRAFSAESNAEKTSNALSSGAKMILECLDSPEGLDRLSAMSMPMSNSLFNEVVLNIHDSDRALTFFNWTTSHGGSAFKHSNFTIRLMTETLNKMNRRDESEKLRQTWRQHTFPGLMQKYSQQGNAEATIAMLKQISTCSTQDINLSMQSLCKVGNTEGAIQLFKVAKDLSLKPTEYSYAIIVYALRCSNTQEDIYEVLREVRLKNMKPDVVLSVSRLLGLVHAGEIGKALETFRDMAEEGSIGQEPECYSGLVQALCKIGRLEEACEIVERVGTDGETLNSLVSVLLHKNNVDKAREIILLVAVKHGSSSVKVLTCNNVLHTLCKDPENVKDAFEMLERMQSLGLEADKYTYSILITRLCKSMMVDRAKLLLEHMNENGCVPDARAYNPLVEELSRVGKVQEADNLARAASWKQCTSVFTYNNLISGFLKVKQVKRAFCCLRSMLQAGPVPDVFTYNIFMEGLCRLGIVRDACKLLRSMSQEGILPDIVTYNTLIDGLRETGNFKGALKLMRQLTDRGCVPNVITYTSLMKWYTRKGMVDAGVEVFRVMVEKEIEPTVFSYNTVISALCKAGRLDQAHRLFGVMVNKGCTPNEITYRFLIHGLCMNKELDRAMVLVETMGKRGCVPDVTCYNSIVGVLCEQGRVDEAYELIQGMPCVGDKVLFRTLVRGLCKLQIRGLSEHLSLVNCDEI